MKSEKHGNTANSSHGVHMGQDRTDPGLASTKPRLTIHVLTLMGIEQTARSDGIPSAPSACYKLNISGDAVCLFRRTKEGSNCYAHPVLAPSGFKRTKPVSSHARIRDRY
ncbi:hypothetical protein RRG08_026704 [Elysia crispata]|uniref:Uncharacterized protein n=1 Tax=Elysia crispata TaxID=231223 RepID=A0AAE0XVA0_9GAST|nr:hypothetical protein RRG08_026704 [Elysia crispata]